MIMNASGKSVFLKSAVIHIVAMKRYAALPSDAAIRRLASKIGHSNAVQNEINHWVHDRRDGGVAAEFTGRVKSR